MTNAEKGLEEVLLEIGNRLLSLPSAVEELLPLLDQAETLLSRVEQSPSESMSVALHPAIKGLTSMGLLRHSDVDVKVAVASCISEITRITAPEAPYGDDLMKDIFQMIVESFEKLDDMQNRSYSKRVSILETVAKVRSCVVMLDLECDALILEMFHHFLKTIRDSHPGNVFSSMETIMTAVIEESEDVSPDLLSCLLTSMKKGNEDTLQIERRLAEKVIGNCALKLKPCLVEAIQSLGASLDDYSEIVALVCQSDPDQLVQGSLNVSSECLADDSKLSVRTISQEPPKGSEKLESEVAFSEEVSNAADKSPKSAIGNGTIETENVDSSVERILPDEKIEHSSHSILAKHAAVSGVETDKVDTASDHSMKEAGGHENYSVTQTADITEPSRIDSDKEAAESTTRSKGGSGQIDSSQFEGATDKEAETTALEAHTKMTEFEAPSEKSVKDDAPTISSAPSEESPETVHPKRGRPSGSKSSSKKVRVNAGVPVSPSGSGKSTVKDQAKNEEMPSTDIDSKKQNEGVMGRPSSSKNRSKKVRVNVGVPVSPSGSGRSTVKDEAKNEEMPSTDVNSKKQNAGVTDLEPKVLGRSVKKGPLRNIDNGGNTSIGSDSNMDVDVTSDSEGKILGRTGSKSQMEKASEGEISGKHQVSKSKQQKGRLSSEGKAAIDPISKEKVSSKTDAKADQHENHLVETPKVKSRKRHAREKEIFESPEAAVKYDESLVGAKIKVWWPDDKQFYPGVVDSYDPIARTHKVLYVDGDEETLLLKDEVFTFLKGDEKDEDQEDSTPVVVPEMSRKKAKMSGSSSKKLKMVTSSKGGRGSSASKGSGSRGESTGKHGVDATKLTGGRRGSSSKSGNRTDDGTPPGGRSKEKAGSRSSLGSPKAGSTPKEELSKEPPDASPKTTMKSKDGMPKPGSKANEGVPKSGSKSKDGDAKSTGKSNREGKSAAGQMVKGSGTPTPKSGRPEANGKTKGKTGSSKRQRNEASTSDINANAKEGEGRSRKKRRR